MGEKGKYWPNKDMNRVHGFISLCWHLTALHGYDRRDSGGCILFLTPLGFVLEKRIQALASYCVKPLCGLRIFLICFNFQSPQS